MKEQFPLKEAPRAPKCILWGGYGWGNVGDEITLAVALRDMSERYGSCEVAILSPCPGYTKALFPETDVIPYVPVSAPKRDTQVARALRVLKRRWGFRENRYEVNIQFSYDTTNGWAEAVKHCELLYLVGGGYLTDLYDLESLLLPVEVARLHDVTVETAPLGIGPFNDSWSARKLQCALRDARVRVRDVDSQTICNDVGITAECRRDDGFRIMEVIAIDKPAPFRMGPIGINFYTQDGGPKAETVVKWWREVLILFKSSGLPIEGFCFHNSLQSDFSQTVQLFVDAGLPGELVCAPAFDFRDACNRITNYRAILTSRFHAAIIAGVAGIPVIAVADGRYYRSKMTSACQAYRTSRVIDVSVTQPTEILRVLQPSSPSPAHTTFG